MVIAICMIGAFIAGMLVMDYIVSKDMMKEKNEIENNCKKLWLYYHIFNMWLDMKQQGKKLGEYMEKKGYKRVAIYGMKELGERLFVELRDAGVEIVCVIDSNKNVLGNFTLISPEDEIPPVDLLIITADYYYAEIEKKMREKVDCPILSASGLLGNAFDRNL